MSIFKITLCIMHTFFCLYLQYITMYLNVSDLNVNVCRNAHVTSLIVCSATVTDQPISLAE